MAARWEQNISTGENELVFDGWEQGINDSPHSGIADMRNINNDSIPGIAMCNYKLSPINYYSTPITNLAFTANTSDNTINFTGYGLQEGQTIVFTGASLPSPLVAGTYYWVIPVGTNNNKVQLYTGWKPGGSVGETGLVTLTTVGSGSMNFSTVNMASPVNYAVDTYRRYTGTDGGFYVLDSANKVWADGRYLLSGNTSSGNGNGIAVWKNYLLVFGLSTIDVYDLYINYAWSTAWTGVSMSSNDSHYAKVGQDDILYFCDGRYVDSIIEVSGKTFNPSDSSTYTANFGSGGYALRLPINERTSVMEESSVGVSTGSPLYIGTTTSNLIYPWDRTSTSYDVPIPMPEIGCFQMLNINRLIYILAGNRGNIYYTNGSTVILFKSIPKYTSQSPYPLFNWGGIMVLNNNLCFGTVDTNTAGTAQNNASGCWAITLTVNMLSNSIAGAIRYKGESSIGKKNATLLIPHKDGLHYWCGWYDTNYGGMDYLDTATPSFNALADTYLETDIVPIGTALQPKTLNTIEFKLDTPLVSGEEVRISIRSDLSSSYTQAIDVVATATNLPIDGSSTSIPIQLQKWVQCKAELKTVSGGSFVRLKEIRLR